LIKDIINGLNNNNFDIAISTFARTPPRLSKVDFSCPYFSEYRGILHLNNPALLRTPFEPERVVTTIKEANTKEVIVGIVTGTIAEMHARSILPNATFKTFPQWMDALNTVHVIPWYEHLIKKGMREHFPIL
jgi:ABC-type amino acid transport substrate-binding protein